MDVVETTNTSSNIGKIKVKKLETLLEKKPEENHHLNFFLPGKGSEHSLANFNHAFQENICSLNAPDTSISHKDVQIDNLQNYKHKKQHKDLKKDLSKRILAPQKPKNQKTIMDFFRRSN